MSKMYKILKRGREESEDGTKKTVSSILAAACVLEGIYNIHFSLSSSEAIIKAQLEAIYSEQVLDLHIDDINSMVVLLSIGSYKFVGKAFSNHINYLNAQKQFENMNDSIMKG